jgi:hypothetical protein
MVSGGPTWWQCVAIVTPKIYIHSVFSYETILFDPIYGGKRTIGKKAAKLSVTN